MIKIDAKYSDYRDDSDPNYPGGKAVDATSMESLDGTPYKKNWMNDINGARQALYYAAFGSLAGVSGNPDNISDSDTLKAVVKLISNSHDKMFKTVTVSGTETVIAWADLGLSEGTYQVVLQAAGNYPEFLPFGYSIASDGVHIFPHRLIDGEIVSSTRRIKWGSFKWGAKNWGAYSSMPVNIVLKEVTG